MVDPVFYLTSTQGDRTGGPECIHQLTDALIRRGHEAYIVPLKNFRGRTPDSEYSIYQYKLADRVPKRSNAVLLSAEVSPIESFRDFRAVPPERTWMWWLSVHNNPDPRARYFRGSDVCCEFHPRPVGGPVDQLPRIGSHTKKTRVLPFANANTLPLLKESWERKGPGTATNGSLKAFGTEFASLVYNRSKIEGDIGFISQSVYGQGFCRSVLGQNALPVTDYLRRPDVSVSKSQRKIVLYNGAKGYSMVTKLRKMMPKVEFAPIEGMSFQQVCEALAAATMYVELGVPPGRDRLPRESVHFGTPVALLCRGSAYCWDDFPLPEQYRVPFVENWENQMVEAIQDVLNDPGAALQAQSQFAQWISGDKERYETEVDQWVSAVIARM